MKKRVLLILSIIAILCCFFAITASAQKEITGVTHTYYVVTSQTSNKALELQGEGKETIVLSEVYASTVSSTEADWIAQFEEGAHIELIFAESIVESVSDKVGILLNKAITVTVRYNGYCHLITNTQNRENVFVLRHSGAQINFIGSTNIYDENGDVIKNFTYDPNDLSKNTVQIRHGKVYCWVFDGSVYAENISSLTGEELVYTIDDDSSADTPTVNTYEFVDCSIKSSSVGLGLIGKDSTKKIVIVRRGYCNSIQGYTICNGTLFENCEIDKFQMDCWGISNQMAEFINCKIGTIVLSSGRTHLKLIDCTVEEENISQSGDGGGDSFILVYTSPSCEAPGNCKILRSTGKGTAQDLYVDVADAYNAENSAALGHNAAWNLSFNGIKYLSTCLATKSCTRCDLTENSIEIGAIIVPKGYSCFEDPEKPYVCMGFDINLKAIAQYEEITGGKINIGAVVAIKEKIGQGVCPLDENGNAITLSSGNVIKVDITEFACAALDVKVTLGEGHLDTDILMSGYIIEEDGEKIDISYIQEDKSSLVENGNFAYVSYSQVLAKNG
ncbi:MAG: hypothetical protein IJ039_02015 [Clostridia bacterium]|nr:hypothetical protein [Clostridia bacterium]